MDDGMVCFDNENLACQTFEGPEIQGSRRMVNVPGNLVSKSGGCSVSEGEKVKRKVLSPLRCSTFSDMVRRSVDDCGRGLRSRRAA